MNISEEQRDGCEWFELGTWLALGLGLALLWWQAHHGWWWGHLASDIVTFHARASHFFAEGTWAGMAYNEHIPGTLWYFVTIGWLVGGEGVAFEKYSEAVLAVNVGLIVAHFLFYKTSKLRSAPWLFLGMLVAMGPQLLFRFELLVSLLVLLAWKTWTKQSFLAGGLLGLAVAVKAYPLILVPLFVFEGLRRREWRVAMATMGGFVVFLAVVVGAYVSAGGGLGLALDAFSKHGLKPIGLEGLWGNAAMLWGAALTGGWVMAPIYGIHGLEIPMGWPSNTTLNLVTLIPLLAVYGLVIWRGRSRSYLSPVNLFLLLFAFVLFGKVLNPHYSWWAFAFFPLIDFSKMPKWMRWGLWLSVLVAWVLTQVVYPINYSAYLDSFYERGSDFWLIFLNWIRNILFVMILLAIMRGWRILNPG